VAATNPDWLTDSGTSPGWAWRLQDSFNRDLGAWLNKGIIAYNNQSLPGISAYVDHLGNSRSHTIALWFRLRTLNGAAALRQAVTLLEGAIQTGAIAELGGARVVAQSFSCYNGTCPLVPDACPKLQPEFPPCTANTTTTTPNNNITCPRCPATVTPAPTVACPTCPACATCSNTSCPDLECKATPCDEKKGSTAGVNLAGTAVGIVLVVTMGFMCLAPIYCLSSQNNDNAMDNAGEAGFAKLGSPTAARAMAFDESGDTEYRVAGAVPSGDMHDVSL